MLEIATRVNEERWTLHGARVRDARERAGLTQAECALRARWCQGYWSRLESGDSNVPRHTAFRVYAALKVLPPGNNPPPDY